jgi:hypothetical protein
MKTFQDFIKESDDTPEGIPKHIWDLHKKHIEAEKKLRIGIMDLLNVMQL